MNTFETTQALITFIENSKRITPKVSLEKMRFYCDLFNNPEQRFLSIHVTGTNGKGSVVASLSSIFRAAGLHVATFTSPYITCFNERIMMDNQMISDKDLLRIGNKIINKFEKITNAGFDLPSFFEFTTLLAFLYFSEFNDLDLAIIEVGIGGRLDSTNVINPLMSIITNVDYDHQNVLGNTLPEILTEKLGIVKQQVPLITGIKNPNLLTICREYTLKTNSLYYAIDTNSLEVIKSDLFGTTFIHPEIGLVKVALPGYHQIENALTVILAIKVYNNGIFRKMKKSNFTISNEVLLRGLKETKWPGRLEVMSKEPLVVIDGAHNKDGISRIAEFVKSLPYPTKRCIFACSHDKDKEGMIPLLEPMFDEMIFTAYTYKRHSDAEELFNLSNHPNKRLILDINQTIEDVWKKPSSFNLFIGSLYFVSEIRPLLIKKAKNN